LGAHPGAGGGPPPPPPTHTQTEAEAEAKAADVRCKHLQKQLGEQRKALAAKEKEGSKLHQELERERAAVQAAEAAAAALGHDPAAAAALEGDAEAARGEVQRWRDRVDELSAQLAGGFAGEATLGARWRLLRAGECTRRTCWAQGVGLFEADQLLLLHKCSPGCRCPRLLPVCLTFSFGRGGHPRGCCGATVAGAAALPHARLPWNGCVRSGTETSINSSLCPPPCCPPPPPHTHKNKNRSRRLPLCRPRARL
jgi:hypothetical protein